ncbi:type I-U CRISPR-associated protein Cas5/Cas6 [Pseudonocardia sp. C8]|nr:type I-U CRISPR-associated protein Csb2 [Pseudonocardia sp. C8]MBC3189989.1 type I-U CRISPR-associated protein Cas5/Cas6 [Pseudonocardia sp. C8]
MRATPLLGTYRGHRPDATPETIPSVARLHAALLCAAGFGPRAVAGEDGWVPCEADEAALRWVEENPPTEMRIPQLRVSRQDAVAYRNDGTIGPVGGARGIRTLAKHESVTAVDGPFTWTWREPPPEPVAEALRALCPDVPHLGTAECPVTMEAAEDDPEPTHVLDREAMPFSGGPGTMLDVPAPGRLDELVEAHRLRRTGRLGSDRAGSSERSASPVPPRGAVRPAMYRPAGRTVAEVPWPEVLLVPLDRRIHERDRVRWCVAAHKALIKMLDAAAPPLLTGVYPDPGTRPANRLALQILDRDVPARLPAGARSALAVLLPPAAPSELELIYRAVAALRNLTVGRRRGEAGEHARQARVSGAVEVVHGDALWLEPAPGTVRVWRSDPPAVPDTRGQRGWTFTHAALLSLGFVWQGSGIARVHGRGAERDHALVDAVNAAGAVVLRTDPVRRSTVQHYAHHVHHDAVVRPYRVALGLGQLGGPCTVQAIGQSRHLGGGLLVPLDVAEGSPVPEHPW